MKRSLLVLTLLVLPIVAQKARVDNPHTFRQDLSAAVQRGPFSTEEKQRYDTALKALDAKPAAGKSGGEVDKGAVRSAMQDLTAIAKSPNLSDDDRVTLRKHIDAARAKSQVRRKQKPVA